MEKSRESSHYQKGLLPVKIGPISGAPDYYVERRDDDANDRIVMCTDWTNLNIRRQTKGYARLLIRADACARRYARAFDRHLFCSIK